MKKEGTIAESVLSYLCIALIILGAIALFLDLTSILDIRKSVNTESVFMILVIAATVLLFIRKRHGLIRPVCEKILKTLFIMCLFLVTLSSLNFGFVASAPLLKTIASGLFLIRYYLYVILLSLASLVFYTCVASTGSHAKAQVNRYKAEESRKKSFHNRFPGLDSIPLLRRILKWMYTEGWVYSITLIVLFILSLSLMLPGLGKFVTTDEPRWLNYFEREITTPSSLQHAKNSTFIDRSYGRSVAYWDSYLSGNLIGTTINGGSGITTNFLHFPAYFFQDSPIETYLFLSRITIVLSNLAFLALAYFFLKRFYSKNAALIFVVISALLPAFIGYSRIVNHDSINGMYIIIFLLSAMLGLKTGMKRYFTCAGIFYSLSLLTSGKSAFLTPLLLFMPIMYQFLYDNKETLPRYIVGLPYFFLSSLISFLVLMPGAFIYPSLVFDKLFFQEGLVFAVMLSLFLLYLFVCHNGIFVSVFRFLKRHEKLLLRVFISVLLMFIIWALKDPVNLLANYVNGSSSFLTNLSSSIIQLVFSTPIPVLAIFVVWMGYYLVKPRIDFSVTLMAIFWAIFFFALLVKSPSKLSDKYLVLNVKYQLVIIFFFIMSLGSAAFFKRISRAGVAVLCAILVAMMAYSGFSAMPNYALYTNAFMPSGYLLYPNTWGFGSYEAAEYINSNYRNITIYDAQSRISRFLNKDITLLGWTRNIDKDKPDFVVIYYLAPSSNNRYKEKFEFYWQTQTPLWRYQIKGIELVGVYQYAPPQGS